MSDSTFDTSTLQDITQINTSGFGSTYNKYAWSSAVFDGALYIGTLNAKNKEAIDKFILGEQPDTKGAEIWKGTFDGTDWTWEEMVGEGGGEWGSENNFGVRKMLAYGDHLFAVTANDAKDSEYGGFDLWNTTDGVYWDRDISNGEPSLDDSDTDNISGRGLAIFDGYLYVGIQNSTTGAQLWRRAVESNGDWVTGGEWEKIITDGCPDGTDSYSEWFSDIAVFDGQMYMGNLSTLGGKVFRSSDGETFETVFDVNTVAETTTAVDKLVVYDESLMVGTMDRISGCYVFSTTDGASYDTQFSKGAPDNETNTNNYYAWYLEEYTTNGRLYFSTLNDVEGFYFYSTSGTPGSGQLAWTSESTNGFDNPNDFGVRTMENFEASGTNLLILGIASYDVAKVYSAVAKYSDAGGGPSGDSTP